MQNLQAVNNIVEAPPQVVARDAPDDSDLQLLENYLRRQCVQEIPEPPWVTLTLTHR